LLRSEILDLEERADLPPRALGNHQRIRRREPLKPRGKVRGLADDRPLLRRTTADKIADDDQAAGDAEPHPQPFPPLQLADRLDDRKSDLDCPLSVVLMRPRKAEIGQHAVAHILRDKPAGTLDDGGDAVMIRADDLTQILRVEARRQRR
jgi:hypothetical protein